MEPSSNGFFDRALIFLHQTLAFVVGTPAPESTFVRIGTLLGFVAALGYWRAAPRIDSKADSDTDLRWKSLLYVVMGGGVTAFFGDWGFLTGSTLVSSPTGSQGLNSLKWTIFSAYSRGAVFGVGIGLLLISLALYWQLNTLFREHGRAGLTQRGWFTPLLAVVEFWMYGYDRVKLAQDQWVSGQTLQQITRIQQQGIAFADAASNVAVDIAGRLAAIQDTFGTPPNRDKLIQEALLDIKRTANALTPGVLNVNYMRAHSVEDPEVKHSDRNPFYESKKTDPYSHFLMIVCYATPSSSPAPGFVLPVVRSTDLDWEKTTLPGAPYAYNAQVQSLWAPPLAFLNKDRANSAAIKEFFDTRAMKSSLALPVPILRRLKPTDAPSSYSYYVGVVNIDFGVDWYEAIQQQQTASAEIRETLQRLGDLVLPSLTYIGIVDR